MPVMLRYRNLSIDLEKWLNVHLRTKWLWVQVTLQSLKTFLGKIAKI